MERDKRKKSKIPCLFGGNGENSNRKTIQPRSPSNDPSEQKMYKYEVEQISSKQVYGSPVKTLLAKEMSNETSTKKWSPNLIAKLMGLDGLPSLQPIHKQQKKPSYNSLKNNRRNEKPYSYQLTNKTATEQQQFKDVYEDPEASHVANHQLYSSPKRRSTKQELGYIQERCDEMLRESIAIKNKLERVDSNSELMYNFLHNDQQDFPYGSLCNQITVLKPSNSVRNGPHKRYENGRLAYSRRSPTYREEIKDEINDSPTRIVLLKPNLAKIYNNDRNFVRSVDNCRKINTESSELRSSRHKLKEAREIARHITSQMKEDFENGNVNLFDSARNSFDQVDRPRHSRSSSDISESAVIREAKKRLSHRWNTHEYKDVGIVDKFKNSETRNDNRNYRTSDYHEVYGDEKIIVHNEPYNRAKNKGPNGNFYRSKSLRFSKKSQYSQHCSACCGPEFDNILHENHSTRKRPETYFPNVDHDDQESQPEPVPEPEPESSEGSKEVDQNGQLSVLEVSPTEDVSSGSDCFERVSSQLHELRKQLRLLKKESGSTYDIPNDDETEQESSFMVSDQSDNWKSSYLTDFLQNSGFYNHDPYTFMTTWYSSSDSRTNLCLFDHLEKKYSHDSTVSTSERRLFHDRINEALFAISKNMVSCSWVNPGQRGIQKTLLTELGFEDQLQKLLVKQEKEASEDFEDPDWLKPVEEIDIVGKQIAEVLVNELVFEMLTV